MSPAATTNDARRLRLRAAGLLAAAWLAACAGPAAADGELRTARGDDHRDALAAHAAGEDPQRWAAEVRQLLDAPPAPGGVVFVGSSSIRGWRSLATDMAGLPVVRHGFGGSKLFDACYWSDELVTRHRPSAVVLFSGTNDLAGERPKSAAQVRDLFRLFVQRVRRDDPELPIAWIAITPTPARAKHVALVRAANELVRAECAADPRLAFVDPSPDLATPDGAPDPRFFQRDGLHLNADGYAVWTRHVRPVAERLHAQRTAADADRR